MRRTHAKRFESRAEPKQGVEIDVDRGHAIIIVVDVGAASEDERRTASGAGRALAVVRHASRPDRWGVWGEACPFVKGSTNVLRFKGFYY